MAKHLLYPVNFRDPESGEVVTFGPGDKLPAYAVAELDDPRFRSYWTDDAAQSKAVAKRMQLARDMAEAEALLTGLLGGTPQADKNQEG